jgi:hypothetical protein
MFPLTGKDFPSSTDELASSIHDALAGVLKLPKNSSTVKIDGGGRFPSISKLKVDLDGASVNGNKPPPKPQPVGKRQPGIEVKDLEVVGRPIKYEKSKLDFTVKAKDVSFDFARDKKGNALLVLTDARQGHVSACISKQDLQALLLAVTQEVGEQQKVKIQDLSLNLTQQGPRSIAADVRITGKKLMVTSTLNLQAALDIDDEFNATLSHLQVSGEGVVGMMVSKLIQSKLKPYEGQKFPLVAFSLGDITLRDLSIGIKKDVQVSGEFGSEAA